MLFLSKPALKYAISMCAAEPRYVVLVAPADQETRLRATDYIRANIRNQDCEFRLTVNGLEVNFMNGSNIKVVRPTTEARGYTAHLVIADENLNRETMNHVQSCERQFWRRYNELHHDDDWLPF